MSQFDFADPDMVNSKRTATIVPQQALFFMNSPMAVDAARKLTERPEFVSARDDVDRVIALYDVIFQRHPRADEVKLAREFLKTAGADSELAQDSANKEVTPKDQRIAERAERQKQAREKRMQEAAMNKQGNARRPVKNEGSAVERKPLTPWERYVQALLFTNEIAYVN
jgi:hypothetical protein